MEIYLVRHTAPDIAPGICYGQADVPLTGSFQADAANVLAQLPRDIDVIFTSPLSRCTSLATQMRSHSNIPIVVDKRLIEINFGEWELMPWNSIDRPSLKRWMDDYVNNAAPEGESYRALFERCVSFMDDLKKSAYRSVVITTHHGVLKSIHAHLHDMSLYEAMELQFPYGSVTHKTLASQ